MNDDLFSLKVLIVSEAAPERELMRQAAAQASAPVEVFELKTGDSQAASELLARENHDVVFFDSRLPKDERQKMLDAIRAAPSRPLAVFVGAAEMKTRVVLTAGLEIDSTLAKPVDVREARQLLDVCIRARLPRRVLIIDDSSTVRSDICKVLQAGRFKFQIEQAADGSVATDLVKKQRYDIVFLACEIPGIDGFAAFAELKRVQPDMQVVMITATRDMRVEDRARAEGAADFLYKPFFAKDIDAVLNRLFGLFRPRWN